MAVLLLAALVAGQGSRVVGQRARTTAPTAPKPRAVILPSAGPSERERRAAVHSESLKRGTNFLVSRDPEGASVVEGTLPTRELLEESISTAYDEVDSRHNSQQISDITVQQSGEEWASPVVTAEEYGPCDCECEPTLVERCKFYLLPGNWPVWHHLHAWHPDWLVGARPLQGPDGARYLGIGDPLITASWKNRPFGGSWFLGALWATGLSDNVEQGSSMFGGARLGWDFDYYLGGETRIGFATPSIYYPLEPNLPADNSRLIFWDVSLLYYPWGDAQWRPYILVGLGMTSLNFDDVNGSQVNQPVLGLPFGCGFKYRWNDRLVLRMELLDNVAFGSGANLDDMHNISLTGGIEYRFGGKRDSYWPWNPSRRLTF
jgi:hypothetical protein